MNYNKKAIVNTEEYTEDRPSRLKDKTGATELSQRSMRTAGPCKLLNLQNDAGPIQRGVTKAVVLAGAGIVTVGLLGLMTILIADEFEPKDRVELAAFEINAKPDEVPLLTERTPPKLLDPIDVPPPPPIVDIPVTDRPLEPVYTPGNPGHVFDPKPYVVPTVVQVYQTDSDPTPLVRGLPTMPPRANRSGHCRISFDISPNGKPYNVEALICSQPLFERAAIRSVQKWVYRPKIQDGLPVTRRGLETRIRFELRDERGDIIAE
ncbi:MAG: energy transducer TonB [Litorimonas sp.]